MSTGERIFIGAMSGTSADGVDVAIVNIGGRGLEMTARLLGHQGVAYEPAVRQRIFQIRQKGETGLSELTTLGREISLTYSRAIQTALGQAGIDPGAITAVAVHGQTLFHNPPDTLQWIDPSLVASETGCTIVSDFRRADCAAGGQGAPLVPFADFILFRSQKVDRICVNIGGIANVTSLPRTAPIERVLAWDSGPGSCISDYLMRKHFPEGPGIDVDGGLAATGKVHRSLFNAFSSDSFFMQIGTKSTDGPTMIQRFEKALADIGEPISLPDQLATACFVTVSEIGRAAWAFGGQFLGEWIVSGGGTKNTIMMRFFDEHITSDWKTTDDFGVPSQAKEAVAFALLGAATIDNIPANVPSATGARRPVVLGSITPKP